MKFKLINEIIKRSKADNWDDAKREWKIDYSYLDEKYETCLCGHYPIKEVIVLKNKNSNEKTVVGNCCINKFFENKTFNKFFKAITERRINEKIINFSYEKSFLTLKERNFLMNVWRKRNLSPKQIEWYLYLRDKIFFKILKEAENDIQR